MMRFQTYFLGIAVFLSTLAASSLPIYTNAVQRCDFIVQIASMEEPPETNAPNEIVRVAWDVVDVNSCGWPEGMLLVFAEGERMSGPAELKLQRPSRGEVLRISFDVQAPEGVGEHVGIWQLSQDGENFGPRLVVQLLVAVPSADDFIEPLPADQLPSDGELVGSVIPETYMVTAAEGTPLGTGEQGSSQAFCPDGVVVGGGWLLTGTAYGARVHTSWMLDEAQGEGWTVAATNPSFLQATLWARVICLRNTPGDTSTSTSWGLNVPAGEEVTGSIACLGDSVLTGGGFILPSSTPGVELRLSGPKWEGGGVDDEWAIEVYNAGDSLKSVAQQAVCLTGVSASNTMPDISQVAVLPINAWGPVPSYAVSSCPGGTMPSSGGMSVLGDVTLNFPSSGMAGNGWMVSAENPNLGIYSMYSMVNCLSFP